MVEVPPIVVLPLSVTYAHIVLGIGRATAVLLLTIAPLLPTPAPWTMIGLVHTHWYVVEVERAAAAL